MGRLTSVCVTDCVCVIKYISKCCVCVCDNVLQTGLIIKTTVGSKEVICPPIFPKLVSKFPETSMQTYKLTQCYSARGSPNLAHNTPSNENKNKKNKNLK